MASTKMLSLIILLWILPYINAGQKDHFQTVHDAIETVLQDQENKIQRPIVEPYQNKITPIITDLPTVVVLPRTNNSVYILDTSGFLLQYVQGHSVGLLLSDFMSTKLLTNDYMSENSMHKAPSDIDLLSITHDLCYGYNLTLADINNGTFIETVRSDRCGGSTLRSFLLGKPSEFCHLTSIALKEVPITELTVEDIRHFPELQHLLINSVNITHMENGLLCYNLNITMLDYFKSFGSLTEFPRQIFNCTMPLKLEYFTL